MSSYNENESICQFCGKPAIGMEILGCTKQVVCEDHASQFLKQIDPGEDLNAGACYYVRY